MDKPQSLLSHLAELRGRILVCVLSLAAATVISMPFAGRVLEAFKACSGGAVNELFYFSPEEALTVYMRVGLFCGIVISLPVILYSSWSFVAPAFGREFCSRSLVFVLVSFVSFIIGCLFCYFLLLPPSLRFLLSIGGGSLRPLISAQNYFSFATTLTLACGMVFLMPVFVFFLARAGLVNAPLLRRCYPHALIAILLIAAVITPTTDVFNMLAMSVPMVFLYEVSVWVAFFCRPKNKPYSLAEEGVHGNIIKEIKGVER